MFPVRRTVLSRTRVFAAVLSLSVALAVPVSAAWLANGNPVCTSSGEQNNAAILADGAGGAFVVWQDWSSGAANLYVQRMTSTGAVAAGWPANGLALCTAASDQKAPALALDGAGGLFVAWEDYRAGGADANIYLQRITAAGAVVSGWPANGLAICTAAAAQGYPTLCSSAGFVIVAWQDDRSGVDSDVYAQRVSGAAVAQWTAGGVAVCAEIGHQMFPVTLGDGSGGAFLAWQDHRDGGADVYAQRITSAGARSWTATGRPVCVEADDQLSPRMTADGFGGVILSWDDYRNFNADVYAQRVDAAGTLKWTATGAALVTDLAEQYGAQPVGDGSGGAFVAWSDYRGGSGDLYLQRVSSTGSIATGWPASGLPVCTAAGDQFDAVAAPDGLGGVILAWCDARSGSAALDLYAQRITAAGAVAAGWGGNGVQVCNAVNNQTRPAIGSSGGGEVLVAWQDERGGPSDIYLRRITSAGAVDVPSADDPTLGLAPPAPNPSRGATLLRYRLAAAGEVRLEVVDVTGRVVRVLVDGMPRDAGFHTEQWDGRDPSGGPASAGLYFVRLRRPDGEDVRKLTILR